MEEPLKARLIGASILVLLAVALVPELLSGPKNSAAGGQAVGGAKNTRTVTIDLGGAVADGARLEPRPDAASVPAAAPSLPVVESPAPAPATAPVTEAKTASKPEDQPAAKDEAVVPPARAPEATPAAVEHVGATDAPVNGDLAARVGAFGSEATARKLVADLEADGIPAYIAPLSKSGKTLHRVRAGPVPDRATADKLAARLKARGLPVSVVSGG